MANRWNQNRHHRSRRAPTLSRVRVRDLGRALGEELLEPTRIYAKVMAGLGRDLPLYGISHITGGGLIDNLPRILPGSCKAVINRGSWPSLPVFRYIQEAGGLTEREMMRTFNNGIGLVIVTGEEETSEMLARLEGMGEAAWHIGSVEARGDGEEPVLFAG